MLVKLERCLFYVFVFFIPFQTRIILFEWTRLFNEWTAAFLYVTDILLIAVLILWAIRKLFFFDTMMYQSIKKIPWWGWGLVGFFIISAISISQAEITGLAWYRLAKLAEFILLFLYVKSNFRKLFPFETVAGVIVASGFFQALIAIIQYAKQGSIGLKILGESHIAPEIYNVAVFIASNGIKYMRAYGTTPHPNVLAAWMVASLFAFYFVYFKWQKKWLLGIYVVMVFGLLFTFSRTMIGVWGLAALAVFITVKKYRKQFYPVAIVTVIVGLFFVVFFWPQAKARILISGDEEAVTQRILYNEIAGGVTKSNPVFGVGIGQAVPDLMKKFRYYPQYFYQPVHNIYLLISSETGFAGLIAFLTFLFFLYWRLFKNKILSSQFRFTLCVFSFAFLLIGLFDHFLWTLQQGSFVFWLALVMLTIRR